MIVPRDIVSLESFQRCTSPTVRSKSKSGEKAGMASSSEEMVHPSPDSLRLSWARYGDRSESCGVGPESIVAIMAHFNCCAAAGVKGVAEPQEDV